MDSFLKAIGALNDETRVLFLKFLIVYGKSCVCEFEESFSMLQPRISRHLKILKDAGFITSNKEGQRVYYFLNNTDSTLHKNLLKEVENLELSLPNKVCACDIQGARAL
ncbi:MAG: ArsR/SmtB family transcription factor [Campylobacterales bacterium]